MAGPLRILFTNNTLAKPAGTELSLHDYASGLAARGHTVAAFSPHLGEVAERLRQRGLTVVDDLDQLPWRPQVIHGHHEWETTVAALRFSDVPVVSFCRGPYVWQEAPCLAPNAVRWAAVDEPCRARLLEAGIAAEKIELMPNGVDLTRFVARGPLPAAPKRVLVLSNYASESNFLPAVRAACESIGAELEVIGAAVGKVHSQPETVLGTFDVVLAKGKAALEAIVSGCAVIVCDTAGLGPLVTTENFESLRAQGFGNPCMTARIDAPGVAAALSAIQPARVEAVTRLARETAGLAQVISRLEGLYEKALAQPLSEHSAAEWTTFTSRFMARCSHAYKLGRKMQELWHDSREPDQPDEMDGAKADRLLDAFFNADAKQTKLAARAEKLRAEADQWRDKFKELSSRDRSLGGRIRRWFGG